MFKEYKIVKADSSDKYKAIVISKTAHRIDVYMNRLSIELKKNHVNGDILFDLLLSNGKRARYFESYFNGDSFDFKNFKQVPEVSKNIENIVFHTFEKNIDWIVENPVLSDSVKNSFLKRKKRNLKAAH